MSGRGNVIPLPTARARERGAEPPASSDGDQLAEEQAEISIRVLWCPAQYVSDTYGRSELEALARECGFRAEEVQKRARWISMRQLNTFLSGVYRLVGTEEAFKRACVYKLANAYGPVRFVLRATSPKAVVKMAARTFHLVSSVSRMHVEAEGERSVSLRVESMRPEHESRLVCLSRLTTTASFSSLWGLPPAKAEETACIARGDSACEYHLQWHASARWMPFVIGGILGGAGAWLAVMSGIEGSATWAALPLLGGLIAHVLELRRIHKANLDVGAEIQQALHELADTEVEARQEVMQFHQRQKEWARVLEDQIAERTGTFQNVMERLQHVREARESDLRGFSHDLRNPLAVMRSSFAYLRDYIDGIPQGDELLEDLDYAVDRMERLLTELMETATQEGMFVRVVPVSLDVGVAAEKLRRRLRALVHGSDIRVSVFKTREAPSAIETDELIFDRILDNLLTNAAKYTERGSIVIELDGTPGFLTIKISDTGRGIEQDQIRHIFEPSGSDAGARAARSYGVGLSVVVQLLDQIGGRLEVMSKPNQGTTLWAHFPVSLADKRTSGERRVSGERPEDLVRRVVTIRRADAK